MDEIATLSDQHNKILGSGGIFAQAFDRGNRGMFEGESRSLCVCLRYNVSKETNLIQIRADILRELWYGVALDFRGEDMLSRVHVIIHALRKRVDVFQGGKKIETVKV